MKVLVNRIEKEAEEIASFELVHPQGHDLPAFTAGSHIEVHVSDGIVRQYSLCNNPIERTRYVIAVQREDKGRGGSIAMHDAVRSGSLLEISRPRNFFSLVPNQGGTLLLAGGIGITPILSMAEHLAALSLPFELHYYTRGPRRTAFKRQLGAAHLASHTFMHHLDGVQARAHMEALLGQRGPNDHVYVCGPVPMIDTALGMAARGGWADSHFHYERFSAAPGARPGERAFHVRLASTNRIIPVQAEESVLDALESAGVDVISSCRQGTCGTCLIGILSGIPDHRDTFLSEDEKLRNDCFAPCCSRSKTDELVLDL